MKNLILLFVLSIFYFNIVSGQENIPSVYVQPKCIAYHNGFTYWKTKLENDQTINSPNTCIKEYELYGNTYYLVFGEGDSLDVRPLLIQQLADGCFKEMGNIYPRSSIRIPPGSCWPYYNEQVYVLNPKGKLEKIEFFSKARFVGYLYKKFPYTFREY